MGVEVPSWVAEMFRVLTGDGWPAVDEDEVEGLARLWWGVGEALAGSAPEVTRSARLLADCGGVEGRAREALVAAVGLVTGDGDLTLEKLAAGFGELGDYLHRVALQTQYLKIVVIEELVVLAAEIAYLVAMIPWTFGASVAGVAGLQVLGRQFAMAVVRQLAVAVAVGEVLQVGLDAVAQLAQFVEGWRGEWDGDLTRSAAITGVVGGVLGPVAVGLGHYPGRVLGRALGGVAGRNAGKEAGDWATTVVKGGAHEYATDGVSGAVQGQGWRPDTFSTTAGAVDEGITAAAGLGRRTRGNRFHQNPFRWLERVAVPAAEHAQGARSTAAHPYGAGTVSGIEADLRQVRAAGVRRAVGELEVAAGNHGRETDPGCAGAGRWWSDRWRSGVFQRPLTMTTGLPGNEIVIDHPLRDVPPKLFAGPPDPVPACGDPVTVAAEKVLARVDSLMDQFADPQPSFNSFPGRSRLSRIVTRVLPFLATRRANEVLSLPEHGAVRFFRGAVPGAPVSRVQQVVRTEISCRWSAQRAGGGPQAMAAVDVGATPREAVRAQRLQLLAQEYRAVRDRLDTVAASGEEALRSARDLADVAVARQGSADLTVYGRLVNEKQAGRALLATVGLARVWVRPWAESLAALVSASTVVCNQLAGERNLAPEEWEAAAAAGNLAVLKALARAAEAVRALDAAYEVGSRVQDHVEESLLALERLMLEVTTQHPEGFPADARSDGLRAGLGRLLAELPPVRCDAGIPHLVTIRVITSGLHCVTGDPARAERLIDALLTHRAGELVPEPGRSDGDASSAGVVDTLADLRMLWGVMAQVDRGVEILGIVSERRASPLDSGQLAALTVYWKADVADQVVSDRQWLATAQDAAARLVHGGTLAGAGGHARAAYNGVLNGLLSTGPGSTYAQANRWMNTLFETWVQRAGTPRSGLGAVWSRLRLNSKTPLSARTVGTAQRLAAGFGFSTHHVLADEAVSRGATMLASLARQRRAVGGDGTSGLTGRPAVDLVLAEVWGRWVAREPVPGLASRVVSLRDTGALSGLLTDLTGAVVSDRMPGPGTSGWGLSRRDLRRMLLDDLVKNVSQKQTLAQVVVRWANRLAPVDGATAGPELIRIKEDLEQALHHLDVARRPIATADDVVAHLDPLVREWAIRQNLKLTQGHTIGVSRLSLPPFLHKISQTLGLFVAPTVDLGHRRDAFVDVRFPSSLGLQLTIGREHATSAGARVTVGPFIGLSERARVGITLGAGMRGSWSGGEGIVLRLPRHRGREEEHRTKMRQLLADMVTWREARDEQAAAYRDRLEFLLAAYPELTVSAVSSADRTIGAALTFGAGLPLTVMKDGLVAGPLVSVRAITERTVDARRESAGQLRVPNDQASTAIQRVRVSTGLVASTGRIPVWGDGSTVSDSANTLTVGGPAAVGAVTRESWQRVERKRVDVMVSGQRMDAEYDRLTKSPEELLAEIRINQLEWVKRGMDSRSDVPVELRDTLGSHLVAAELATFEHLVRQVARATWYSGFVIRYSPRPAARMFADVFGILAELALQRDAPGEARRWHEVRNDVLRTEHNWRPRTLLARERGVQARTRGLAFGLQTQTHDQVEVQRTVVQFPPDRGTGRRTGAVPDGVSR